MERSFTRASKVKLVSFSKSSAILNHLLLNLIKPYLCYGNYHKGPKVAVYSFPLDNELKSKWLKTLPRLNFKPSKTSKVCQVYFRPKDKTVTNVSSYDRNIGKMISTNLD